MREGEDGETYLELSEVTERYKLASSTLYHFRSMGLLETYRFAGDRKAYWKVSELEALQKRPVKIPKRDPKNLPATAKDDAGRKLTPGIAAPMLAS